MTKRRRYTPWRRYSRRASLLAITIALALILTGYGSSGAISQAMRVIATPQATATPGKPGRSAAEQPAHLIKHIVFMLEENRSFDNVFGRFPGADGVTTATVAAGQGDVTIPLVPEPYYLWHDLGHDLGDALASIDKGKMDGFSHETYSDLYGEKAAYQQLSPGDIPNLYAYARAFTLSDHTFASMPSSTFPNHLYAIAAQDGGVISNPQNTGNAWGCDSPPAAYVLVQQSGNHIAKSFPCFNFTTMADRFNAAHVSWTYYASPPSDLGYIWSTFDAIKGVRETPQWSQHVKDEHSFAADARAGRLPAFSWVTPRAADSMHPPAPVCPGENWIVDKLNALMSGPDWNSTLVVLAWDDWGGYYDHMAPPPRASGSYGLRVPLLLISPYARRGYVTHTFYTFESVLKTAETLWRLPPLTDQDRTANSLLDSLDLTQQPLAPLKLTPRACPPAPTMAKFHSLLDTALQTVMTRTLGLPLAQIETLHRTQTLARIAQARHVQPAALATALKNVAAAWAGGGVMLQLVQPQDVDHVAYLAERSIDTLLQAAPGTQMFPFAIMSG